MIALAESRGKIFDEKGEPTDVIIVGFWPSTETLTEVFVVDEDGYLHRVPSDKVEFTQLATSLGKVLGKRG